MKRTALILKCCSVVLICAIGVCVVSVARLGPISFPNLSVAFVVPAMSTLLFLCLSIAVPDLYAVEALRFPLTLTVPLVYTGTLFLSMTLLSRVGLSIARVPENFAAMNIWANSWTLLSTFFASVVILSILGMFDGKRVER